jgi:hypothetical protein
MFLQEHEKPGKGGLAKLSKMNEVEFPYKIVDKKRKPGLKAKATIMKIQLVKAAEIFKDKAKDPEQQLYAIHGRVNDREMRIATFAKPQSEEISSKSKLAQFKQRYKRFPALGMKVDVVTDDNGYWKIAV